ncbi:MAG: ABC transporter ATP-binding protein [Xanthomonadales bacterium]|nr:ABC transporter ATP-binding protein [Xanthomonadales bacterium]
MTLELRQVVRQEEGLTHIHETSLALTSAGFNILLGTTLAGKTTLMRLMAGLLPPTRGTVWFDGRDVTGQPVQRRNVSMVYQQFINYPNLSVYENIASPLRVTRMKDAAIRERVGGAADLLRLGPYLDRRPAELSGGQQQRTAIARALVKDSSLILFDEPLANLDYKLREELREELPKLLQDRQCTVVYATTEPSEALLLGGIAVSLHEGRVTQYGPTGEVYRRPADLRTAQVFSDPPINIAPARKEGLRLALDPSGQANVSWPLGAAAAALPDGDYQFAIRPHHVRIAGGSGARDAIGEGAGVRIDGEVRVAELSGSESVVHFNLGPHAWVSQSHGVHRFDVGDRVGFTIEVDRALLFRPDGSLAHAS